MKLAQSPATWPGPGSREWMLVSSGSVARDPLLVELGPEAGPGDRPERAVGDRVGGVAVVVKPGGLGEPLGGIAGRDDLSMGRASGDFSMKPVTPAETAEPVEWGPTNSTVLLMEYPPHSALRIVSLLPAATEIVARLGSADRLVGRSHECDEPAMWRHCPPSPPPRIDPAAPSRAIHDQVTEVGGTGRARFAGPGRPTRATGARSAALYTLDMDTLAALEPDLILTQAACDVCAIAAADVEAAVRKAGVNTHVLPLSPATLDDLFSDILAVGKAPGRWQRRVRSWPG
jgi:hypothetical protein